MPLIAITGQVARHVIGTDAFQETPIVEVCRGITKHHYLVNDVKDIARDGQGGVSHRQHRPARPGADRRAQGRAEQASSPPDYDVADGPARLPAPIAAAGPSRIAGSARGDPGEPRPVIYAAAASSSADAGRGAARVRPQDRHPGGHDPAWAWAPSPARISCRSTCWACTAASTPTTPSNEADLLLAFGVRFDDRVTGKSEFAKHGKIVHIDIDPSEINKNKDAHIPIVSDVKYVLERAQHDGRSAGEYRRLAPADRRLASQRPVHVRPADDRHPAAVRHRAVVEADPRASSS